MLPITRHHSVHVPHTIAVAALLLLLGAALMMSDVDPNPTGAAERAVIGLGANVSEPTTDAEPESEPCASGGCSSDHKAAFFPLVLPSLSRF